MDFYIMKNKNVDFELTQICNRALQVKQLKKLSICSHESEESTDFLGQIGVVDLVQIIKFPQVLVKLQYLTSLKLQIFGIYEIHDLGKYLAKLPILLKLTLSFDFQSSKDNVYIQMIKDLQQGNSIKILKLLGLWGRFLIQSNSDELANAIAQLSQLEALGLGLPQSVGIIGSLNFGSTFVVDKSVKIFIETLQQSKTLKQLILYLNKSTYNWYTILKNFPTKTNFALKIKQFDCQSNVSINSLEQSIHHIKEITYLSLELNNSSLINDHGMSNLTKMLSNNRKLHFFELKICQISDISDKGLKIIGESLKKLKYLKKINIELIGINQISIKGIVKFGLHLQEISSLSDISLHFTLNSFELDELLKFGFAFSQISSLKSLNLDFRQVEPLTNHTLYYLGTSLSHLQQLKKLLLYFQDDISFACSQLIDFADCIAQLKNLSIFTLEFFESQKQKIFSSCSNFKQYYQNLLKNISIK